MAVINFLEEAKMKIPQNLQHRPFFVLPYRTYDGPYEDDTDAEFLSIGLAQWDNSDVSVKVLRYDINNNKWSRQSEEVPINRSIDMTLWISIVLFGIDEKSSIIDKNTFFQQTKSLSISQDPNRSKLEEKKYRNYLESKFGKEYIKERLRILSDYLNNLKLQGRL